MGDDRPPQAGPARLVDRIDGLEAQVRVLERQVDEMSGGERPSVEAVPPVIVWRSLPPAEAAIELKRLAEWVDWLHERYAAAGDWLRPCWWRHGFVVEELAALRTAWLGVYESGNATTATAALQWHESAERCRNRIRRAIATGPGCTSVTHKPDQSTSADPRWLEERAVLQGVF